MIELVLGCFLLFTPCQPQPQPRLQNPDKLEQLAASGNIQENAPVKASAEIIINAQPERVWALLTDINSWPKWQPDVSMSAISGPLQPGTTFTWSTGSQIHSRIALVQPVRQFVWTGVAYKAKAIHVWELEPLPGNRTRVKTRESMQGPLLTLFFSSEKLEVAHQHWLAALKTAAEQPAMPPVSFLAEPRIFAANLGYHLCRMNFANRIRKTSFHQLHHPGDSQCGLCV